MKKQFPLLLLTAAALLSACSTPASSSDSLSSASAATNPAKETTTAAPETEPLFPEEANYEGRTFTVIACDEGVVYTYFEIPEETTGESMNDAIYDRNQQTESHLNIDLQRITAPYKVVSTLIANSAAAGDGA